MLTTNFDGSTYDAESDLQMLGFRMYDNETGRFTTPDLLWSAFPAQTPYHYAYNSPLTYRDPSGLAPEKEKEREELMSLTPEGFDSPLFPALVVEIDHSIMIDWAMTQAIWGSRLADAQHEMQSWWINAAMWPGAPGSGHVYHNINIKYWDNQNVNFKVYLNGRTVSNEIDMNSHIQKLMDAMRTILKADFDFFLPLVDGDYEIIIQSGIDIAKGYNLRMGKKETHLAGLHSSNGEKMATFRLAKEVFQLGGDDRYRYAKMFSNDLEHPTGFYTWLNLTVFDVFSHEVGHQLDYIKYGSNYSMLGAFGKELLVIMRVNELRFRLGLPLEDLWYSMPKGGK